MSENLIIETGNSDESSQKGGDKMEVITDEVAKAKEVIQEDKLMEICPTESSLSGVPVSDDTDPAVSDTQSLSPKISHDSPKTEQQPPQSEGNSDNQIPDSMDVIKINSTVGEKDPAEQVTSEKTSDTDNNMICDVVEPTKKDVNKDTSVNASDTEQESKPEEIIEDQAPSPKPELQAQTEENHEEVKTTEEDSPSTKDPIASQVQQKPPEKLMVELPSVSTSEESNRVLDGEGQKSDSACAPEAGASTASKPDTAEGGKDKIKEKTPPESVYHVKWIQFKAQNTAIVTQNENGPCPLLAIMNSLLLQGRVKLPAMMEMVTSGQLMEYLGDCILENAPKDIGEAALLNYEQNMQDAMDVFHKLQTGLDVNVKFTGVSDFEYTRECIVFDLLNIPLYHGWLVDPESPEVVAAVGSCSYNQLVEKIISQKNANREELMTEALIAEEFLERTAAQLTYHGLSELSTTVKEDELCVFFRNNHFSTVYKHKKELFLLVTDQGFLTESNVVWETLCNVEGDGHFVDAQFRTFRKPEPSTAPIAVPEVPVGTDQQIDQDYLVALSLQQEQQVEQPPINNSNQAWQPPPDGALEPTLSDHQLALRLQEEEDRRAAMAANQRPAPAHHTQQRGTLQHQASTASSSGGSRKKDKSDCTIL